MRVLIDLDDTLVDMMGKAVYYYNRRYGTGIKLSGLTEWELPHIQRWRDIWQIPGFFADLTWIDPFAPQALKEIKAAGHEIVIVSAVPTWESCLDKYRWCHTNLRIPGLIDSMSQVVLTRGKHYVSGDCMIDDRPENLEGRKYPVLFTRPWNSESNIPRASSWRVVLDTLRHYERYYD